MNLREEDAIAWLMQWYQAQCDGEWEEEHGITLESLDNPGWLLTVDLVGTHLEGRILDPQREERGEHDWVFSDSDGKVYRCAGGPMNLREILERFRYWVE